MKKINRFIFGYIFSPVIILGIFYLVISVAFLRGMKLGVKITELLFKDRW